MNVEAAARQYLERLDIYRDVSRRTGSMGRQVQEQPLEDAEKALRAAVAEPSPALHEWLRHDDGCAWGSGGKCSCGLDAVLAAAPRADPSEPMQFGRDFMLEDLWAAYRQGAKETRELAVDLTGSRRDLPTDAEIERACDAYVKMVVERAAARAPGRAE